jgi:uncharacterized protein (TIGR01777 family)
MHNKVLITGGSGLLGTRLTVLLQQKGYKVAHLSRSRSSAEGVKTFLWDPEKNYIEPGAVESAHYIIHLAGASVADHRWTEAYKQSILKSRTDSTRLLHQELKSSGYIPKAFISASAIGYYGDDNGAHWLYESSPAGQDFLASVCKAWESEAEKISQLGIRQLTFRIGVVLSTAGGALPQLQLPVRLGLAAPVGSGNQYMSWIHIDDLCGMMIKSMEEESMEGVYNATGPEPETNERFMRILAEVMEKPYFVPRVPAFAVKLAMGSERAGIVLGGLRVSADKIEKAGYYFQFPGLRQALSHLLDNKSK